MKKWRDVTDCFSEEERYSRDVYLEIDEVYDEVLEVSLFSSNDGPYEIYIRYGIMFGIIYVDADEAYKKREEIKQELQKEYDKRPEPTDEYINEFARKYNLHLDI